jgi:mannose-6-phosphate isomerase-like protein (cupin superfamily)
MVIQRKDMKTEIKDKLRGGEGSTTMLHLADGAAMKHGRLFSEITLLPGASIGEHRHDNETEYYLISEGTGIVADNGKDVPVGPGDLVVTGDGASHSIRNTGKAPLRFVAVIITY